MRRREGVGRHLFVQVGSDSLYRAEILHQLPETDGNAKFPVQHLRSLGQEQRIEAEFHEVGGGLDLGKVIAGELAEQGSDGRDKAISARPFLRHRLSRWHRDGR